MPTKTKLSLVINTKNEEKNLKRCLASVGNWADEIIVVDMASTDSTVAVAKRAGATVFPYKIDHGFADPARNFALSKATGDWVLILDADEELDSEVKNNLKKAIEADQFDVFYLPRKNLIFGKWIEHTGWWPDYQPRLFRSGYLQWPGVVHAQPIVKGRINHLPARSGYAIIHHNYTSLSQYIGKLNQYTSLTAKESYARQTAKPISQGQVFDNFFSEFLSRFFAHQGHEDSVHGAALSLLQANYELVAFLKKWELGDYPSTRLDSESGIRQLRKFQKDLNYWIADYNVNNSVGLSKMFWRIRRKLRV